jgi:site-specific recombinase XerD
MIEYFIHNQHAIDRLQSNPIKDALDRLADHLHSVGYAELTAQGYLQAAEHYGYWLGHLSDGPLVVGKRSIEAFMAHLPECGCPKPATKTVVTIRTALRHLSAVMGSPGCTTTPAASAADLLVQQYLHHLDVNGGLSEATRIYRKRYACEFLESHSVDEDSRISAVTPDDVLDFVMGYARRCRRSSAQVAACSLRSFLRFLHQRGQCAESLVRAVPRIPQWRDEALPKAMNEDQLQQFLASFDHSTATGCRDHAMALLMVDTGLRVGEVVALELEDIDWRAGTFRVRAGKNRHDRLLPLPASVGKSISRYLRIGRPTSSSRRLFLRDRVPVGDPVTHTLVRGAIRRAYQRSGCPADFHGTHILRHTAATRMHQAGVPLKSIADLLGHQSLDTSKVYTRINMTELAAVALPWPEARP